MTSVWLATDSLLSSHCLHCWSSKMLLRERHCLLIRYPSCHILSRNNHSGTNSCWRTWSFKWHHSSRQQRWYLKCWVINKIVPIFENINKTGRNNSASFESIIQWPIIVRILKRGKRTSCLKVILEQNQTFWFIIYIF